MEDRFLPAQLLWIGPQDGRWDNANNWANVADGTGKIPAEGDSLIFDATRSTGGLVPKPGAATDSTNDLGGSFADLTVASGFHQSISSAGDAVTTFTGRVVIEGGTFNGPGDIRVWGSDTSSTIANAVFADDMDLTVGKPDGSSAPSVEIKGDLWMTDSSDVRVQGGSVAWSAGDITLAGGSELAVAAGATFDVRCDGSITGAGAAGGAAGTTVTVNGTFQKTAGLGSTGIRALSFVMVGPDAAFTLGAGTVQFAGAGMTQTGGSTTLDGGNLATDGSIDLVGGDLFGVGTITGDLVNSGGLVHPGLVVSGGTLIVSGQYTQLEGGTLAITLLAAGPGGYGYLQVMGSTWLDGTLSAFRDAACQPPTGTRGTFLSFGAFLVDGDGDTSDFRLKLITTNGWDSSAGDALHFEEDLNLDDGKYDLVVRPNGSVHGRVWGDVNRNGLQDAGEAGLANALVSLSGPGGTSLSALTDADGNYDFTGPDLPLGGYTVSVASPSGSALTLVPADQCPDDLDSDFDPATATAYCALTDGAPSATLDAGFALPATSVSLSASAQYALPGEAVTFTASVSPSTWGGPALTGTVQFYEGSTLLGAATLSQGAMGALADFTTSFSAVGSHSVTAVYLGDAAYSGSASSPVSVAVQQGFVIQMLSSSNPSPQVGEAVTISAQLYGASSVVPTGTVSFYDNGVLMAAVTVEQVGSDGQAQLTTSALTAGSHTITAVYSGDQAFIGATSSLEVDVSG